MDSGLGGVGLYTVFTPWFGLMIAWIFAVKLGWFPLNMFLEPSLWSDAAVDSNYVFQRMLATGVAVSVVVLVALVASRRLRFGGVRWLVPAAAFVSVAAMLLAWKVSGVGYLAFDIVRHMVLPVGTLTAISFAGTMLLTRNSMLETMREDYVLTARAKGLPDKVVRDRHVARNAMLPIVTSFAFSMAFAMDGGVIIESIFSWPGMGQTLVDSALKEDVPLAVGAFVFTGIFVLLAHLAADILYTYLDPRIRY